MLRSKGEHLKKFIVAIFCCLITGTSFAAAPDTYFEPTLSEYATKWLAGGNTYSTPLHKDMASGGYGHLQHQLESRQQGTYSGQYAIDLWAAKEVYEHGAKICQVQIQAAGGGNNPFYTWIDYYWRDNWQCAILCEPKYSGDKCQTYGAQVPCDEGIILQSGYSLIKYGDDDDKGKNRHTNTMQVLKYENEKDTKSFNGYATHTILGINKKGGHGAFVTPIEIKSGRMSNTYSNYGNSYSSSNNYILSVFSNGKETLLCQEGYVPNFSETDCVPTAECKINLDNMCDGFSKSEYNETTHILKSKTLRDCSGSGNIKVCRTTGTCTYFGCRDGYGLESTNSKKCIECSNTSTGGRGIKSNGVCEICESGQMFSTFSKKCEDSTKITKDKMEKNKYGEECWMKTDSYEYKECVLKE